MIKKVLIIAHDLEYKMNPSRVQWFCLVKLLKDLGIRVFLITCYSRKNFDEKKLNTFLYEVKKNLDGLYIFPMKKNPLHIFHPFIPFIALKHRLSKNEKKEMASFYSDHCTDVDLIIQDHVYAYEITKEIIKRFKNNPPFLALRTLNIEKDFFFYHSKKYGLLDYRKYLFIFDAIKMIGYEQKVMKKMQVILPLSTEDAKKIKNKKIIFFPYIYTTEDIEKAALLNNEENKLYQELSRKYENKKIILFINNFVDANNLNETKWFIRRVFPLIVSNIPEAIFLVGGYQAEKYFPKMKLNKNIHIFSNAPSVKPYLKLSDLVVIPTKNKIGVKSKFIEAIYFRKKIVTTSAACYGSGLEKESFFSDNPIELADLCVKALENKLDFSKLYNKFDELYNDKKNVIELI